MRTRRRFICLPLLLIATAAAAEPPAQATFPAHLRGNVTAVSALLERVLPGASPHFEFEIVPAAAGGTKNAFTISDTHGGRVRITGTTASELTGGRASWNLMGSWC